MVRPLAREPILGCFAAGNQMMIETEHAEPPKRSNLIGGARRFLIGREGVAGYRDAHGPGLGLPGWGLCLAACGQDEV